MMARIKDAETKNCAARESNLATTAGMYHWKEPQIVECAEVTNIGVKAPSVPITGSAKNWCGPANLFLEKRVKSC